MECHSYYVEPYDGVNRIVGVWEKPPVRSSLASIGISIAKMVSLAEYDLGLPFVSHAEIYILCKEHVPKYTVQVADTLPVSVVNAIEFLSNNLADWMVTICLNALQENK